MFGSHRVQFLAESTASTWEAAAAVSATTRAQALRLCELVELSAVNAGWSFTYWYHYLERITNDGLGWESDIWQGTMLALVQDPVIEEGFCAMILGRDVLYVAQSARCIRLLMLYCSTGG
jgi:hypothetical protein